MMRVLSDNKPMFSVNFYRNFLYQTYFENFSEISLIVLYHNIIQRKERFMKDDQEYYICIFKYEINYALLHKEKNKIKTIT